MSKVTYEAKFLYKKTAKDIVSTNGTGVYVFDDPPDEATVGITIYKLLKKKKEIPIFVKLLTVTKI